MSAESAFASNNPFRRRGTGGSSTQVAPPALPPLSTPTAFDVASASLHPPFQEAAPTEPPAPKAKIVKKVRVQSPPPSSPESIPAPLPPRVAVPDDDDETSSSTGFSEEGDDPFDNEDEDDTVVLSGGSSSGQGPEPPRPLDRPPPNPFSKTLQDLEHPGEGAADKGTTTGGTAGRASMDVDAFKRLLLTGVSGPSAQPTSHPAPAPPTHPAAGDAASVTDASSVSRQSLFDRDPAVAPSSTAASFLQEPTPRTSHEISGSSDDDAALLLPSATAPTPTQRKKAPPPAPSSRHGKLIKIELGADNKPLHQEPVVGSPSRPKPHSPSDVNKPLPPAPIRRSIEEDAESIFDREAAGKLPDPGPPSPPTTTPALMLQAGPGKKATPAPPPRRHTKSDSRSSTIVPGSEDEPPPRSSVESTRSRSDSVRQSLHAPAPPPPRRPQASSRQSGSFTSPPGPPLPSGTATSPMPLAEPERSPGGLPPYGAYPFDSTAASSNSSSITTLSAPKEKDIHADSLKLSPPPPPPARSVSTRRPPSVRSIEATSRRIVPGTPTAAGKEVNSGMPPPPPPPRQRGSSRGSMDGPSSATPGRRSSIDSVRILHAAAVVEEPAVDAASATQAWKIEEEAASPAVEPGKGMDILADLDALQKEVDALRGKYETAGTRS